MNKKDLPNWDDQPKKGDVWIVDNDNEFPSGFYDLSATGFFYQSCSTANTYNIRCVDDESITVHERPIVVEIDWSSAPEWADRLMESKAGSLFLCNVEQYILAAKWMNNGTPVIFGDTPSHYTIGELELIEMRPIAIDKEWLPEVGEIIRVAFDGHTSGLSEYEANLDGKEVELVYSFNQENGSTWLVVKSECSCHCFRSHCFKPIKTAEELEREALELRLIELQPALMPNDCQLYFDIYIQDLIDSGLGFTAPKGEG